MPKHEGHDRTGDWITRVKMTQDLEQAINDGLYYYEEDLWLQDRQRVKFPILHICLYIGKYADESY